MSTVERPASDGWTSVLDPRALAAPFDLIVIGAGINGAGVARDAAMRGLRVLVLDKEDVASGTTAYSSRLIHGGLRYLEHGEIGLVRESLRERGRLVKLAPHLVRPLRLAIPLYGRRLHRTRHPRWMIKAGLLAYDLLSLDESLGFHDMLAPAELERIAPAIAREGLIGAGAYSDAQAAYPERICVENLVSAASFGAVVLTHTRAERLERHEDRCSVSFRDLLSGRSATASAQVVVNAAGPWADEVRNDLGVAATSSLLGRTKGIHVFVRSFAGAPTLAMYFEARSDHRPLFLIPWNGGLLIGTTDTFFDGSPDAVVAEQREVEYLLAETNSLLPSARLSGRSILYTYAGVRPLPFDPKRSESAVTRRHVLHRRDADGRVVTIVGGKLTTYRSLAEEVVDLVCRKLGRRSRSSTARAALPGAMADLRGVEQTLLRAEVVPPHVTEHLVSLYGARAAEVLALAGADESLRTTLSPGTATIGAEILFAFGTEMARTLTDVLFRRTMTALDAEMRWESFESALSLCEARLEWGARRVESERREYVSWAEKYAVPSGVGAGV
jgi:glycerol-3-phosphate dehydrogenase